MMHVNEAQELGTIFGCKIEAANSTGCSVRFNASSSCLSVAFVSVYCYGLARALNVLLRILKFFRTLKVRNILVGIPATEFFA
jgi:hypothetical protein